MADSIIYHNDLISIVIFLGVIQGTYLAFVFLLSNTKNHDSNKFLGLILLLFALHNFDFWASYSGYTLKVPFLLDISVPFTFLMGPLLYRYICSSLNSATGKYVILHYFPFVIFFVYSLFFVLQPDDFKYDVYISSRNLALPIKEIILRHPFDPLKIRNLTGLFISVQLCIYLLASYLLFMKYLKSRNINLFHLSEPANRWLRNLLFSTTMIVIAAIIIQLGFPGGRIEFLLATCFTFFIYFLSFNLIRGSDFLKQTLFPEKYRKSSLNELMKQNYKTKIEQMMENEKLFLDNLFSMKRLSQNTGIPPNHLSQILNESFHQSFFEFTRSYRIKEAQKLLSAPDNSNINIEEIAYMVGYNSKSAFNKAFLSLTGQTPLSFKKKSMQ